MDVFEVKAKLGRLTFTHDQNRVTVKGGVDALADWRYRYGDVLYGAFGHIFDANNCSVCDVFQALLASYGPNSVSVSKPTEAKCREELRSVGPDVIP